MENQSYKEWVVVFKSGTDYEADMVRDRLDDAGVPAVVLSQRDHAFNLTVGDLARVKVMVPPDRLDEAITILAVNDISDTAFDDAAEAANPDVPKAGDDSAETLFDSGSESIRFDVPDDEENSQDRA